MNGIRWHMLILIFLILEFAMAGCAFMAPSSNDPGGNVLTIAHDVNFPPFEFLKEDEYVGFDLDLINAIAEIGNFSSNMLPMDFNGIIPALQAHQVDLAIAAMSIREDRDEVIDFSIPYYETGMIMAVSPDRNDIVTPEDLRGHTIAVKIGTGIETYVRNLPYASELTIATYDSNNETYLAVITGNADATINDEVTLRYYIANEGYEKLKIVGNLLTIDHYGIAIPEGQTELQELVNNALLEIAQNGTYDQIYEKWFGSPPSKRPGDF